MEIIGEGYGERVVVRTIKDELHPCYVLNASDKSRVVLCPESLWGMVNRHGADAVLHGRIDGKRRSFMCCSADRLYLHNGTAKKYLIMQWRSPLDKRVFDQLQPYFRN